MGDQHTDLSGEPIPALLIGSKLEDPITVSSVSAQSAAVNAKGSSGTRVVALYYKSTDDNCHIAVGADPTATTNDRPLPSNVETYFSVANGHKLAAIQNSTSNAQNGAGGGTLHITQI